MCDGNHNPEHPRRAHVPGGLLCAFASGFVTHMARALLVLSLAAVSRAQSRPAAECPVSVLRVDGSRIQGRWIGADDTGIEIRLDAGPARVARDDLMLVTFAGASPASRPASLGRREALCLLADGGRIRGTLAEAAEGQIRIVTTQAGALDLRLADLLAVRLGSAGENAKAQAELDRWLSSRPSGNDVLIAVRDGGATVVRGALLSLGPEGGRFTFAGRTVPMRPEATYAVVFGGGLAAASEAPYLLTLQDGSRLAAAITKADASAFALLLLGRIPVRLPVGEVATIVVRSDRITFASDLTPTAAVDESLLGTPWPYRRDRAVSNRPLRLAGVEYARGLGVHSRSELAYDLGGRYAQFAATIGIDDAVRPRGDVVFRVVADDREVFNSGSVTGRDEPRPILVDIRKARQVRLIVEYGAGLDLADHANWANARFIR